ncbi:MAG: hypothetical protein ACKVP4_11705 [Hyphomicrobium sp.]
MMIRTTTLALAALAGLAGAANAGDKEYFTQDYKLKKPLHGFSGHSGNYFCDYQRYPERKCVVVNGVEKCKIVGWTLREHCY